MDFVRKIIESDEIESIISLPNQLKNKKLELLILPLEEKETKKDFNPEDFKGSLNLEEKELNIL
ncbi:MAG: hypothetical protein ACOCP8_05170 [archaeon]